MINFPLPFFSCMFCSAEVFRDGRVTIKLLFLSIKCPFKIIALTAHLMCKTPFLLPSPLKALPQPIETRLFMQVKNLMAIPTGVVGQANTKVKVPNRFFLTALATHEFAKQTVHCTTALGDEPHFVFVMPCQADLPLSISRRVHLPSDRIVPKVRRLPPDSWGLLLKHEPQVPGFLPKPANSKFREATCRPE
jgi:hypothetical protein